MTHYVTVAPGFEGLLLDDGCIISTLCKNSRGYANKRMLVDGQWKTFTVHRLVLAHKLGRPIKPGYCACHTCDIRNCINPDHLWEGSVKENSRDRFDKGRIKDVPNKSAPVLRKPLPGFEVIPGLRGEVQPNGCIICTLAKRRDGYAVTTTKVNGKSKSLYPHRLVLEHKLGRPIQPGYAACHSCDNRGCINPDHLWEGTLSENTLDAVTKGRLASCKLSVEQVVEIKQRLARGDAPKHIARDFGMSHRTIISIREGSSWAHVQVEGFEIIPGRPRRRLTLDEVREIRIYLAEGKSYGEIAEIYGVGKTTVGQIARGQSWRE